MDNIKKAQILDKFMVRLAQYTWSTSDGSNFNYENDVLRFSLSSYALHINYKNTTDKSQTGFQFSTNDYKGILQLYMSMREDALEDVFNEILNAEPDIKRELGLEELLDA